MAIIDDKMRQMRYEIIKMKQALLAILIWFSPPLYSQSVDDYFLNPSHLAKIRMLCAKSDASVSESDCDNSRLAQSQIANLLILIKTNPQNFGKLILNTQIQLGEAMQAYARAQSPSEKRKWKQKIHDYQMREQRYYVILRMITWTQ